MSSFFVSLPPVASGGIESINGDTTSAQVIAAGSGIGVSSSAGTTTISNTAVATESFTIWQPDHGTSPTASTSMDTMDVTSSDATITITGNASTKTLNYQLSSALQSTISAAAPTANPTFTGKILFGNYHVEPAEYSAGNSSTALTVNFSNGSSQLVTMTDNCTFTFSNGQSGGSYVLRLLQDATGGRTATWPVAVKWANGTAPILSAATKIDLINLYYDGTNWYGSFSLNY